MDNPYWETEGRGHHIDLSSLRLLAFDLLNIIEANKSLVESIEYERAEDNDFNAEESTLLALHKDFADKAIRQRLLQFALMIRTYDDVMDDSPAAEQYKKHARQTDGSNYIGGPTGDGEFTLRDACNKIIHATEIRPLYDRSEQITIPSEHSHGGKSRKELPDLWHLTGEVELKGKQAKKAWDATIFLQPFIEIAIDRIGFGTPKAGQSNEEGSSELYAKIDSLNFSLRTANCLKNDNIVYVGDLTRMSEAELLRVPNFGRKSLNEVKNMLASMGLHLGLEIPESPSKILRR